MPTNFTENYNLSQWERSDKVLMEDFNSDNAKIDAALAAQQEALAKCGNCSIRVFSYTGNGTCGQDHPTRITFPKMPTMFFVLSGNLMVGRGGAATAFLVYRYSSSTANALVNVSWSGNTMSFYGPPDAASQLNQSGTVYPVIALYAES